MKSIERRFLKIEEKHPGLSSFICFAHTIRDMNFSEARVKIMFNKLVKKEEYVKNEKKGLIKFLLSINKPLNRIENEGIFDLERDKKGEKV